MPTVSMRAVRVIRLYISKCRIKGAPVILKNKVSTYVYFDEYLFVVYTTKGGKEVDGWVKLDRLRKTDEGIGPAPDQK